MSPTRVFRNSSSIDNKQKNRLMVNNMPVKQLAPKSGHQNQKPVNGKLGNHVHPHVGQEIAALRKTPPNDFREVPIFPSSEDILSTDLSGLPAEQFIRKNVISTPYPDANTYLDIHFRLIRKDFMETYRSTIGNFCRGTKQEPDFTPDGSSKLPFYRNVRFVKNAFLSDPKMAERPASWRCYTVSFEVPGKVDWENDKRLMSGSLICLWNAQFKTTILGTVSDSDILKLEKGFIVIALYEPLPETSNWMSFTYTMLECPAFYEPYRAVMEAYQGMTEETLPLKHFILGWTKNPGHPDYLLKPKALKSDYRVQLANGQFCEIRDVKSFSSWPSSAQLGVNLVQRTALHAALTRKVALIQGPPGTGKSFLGRKIISTLLDNQSLWYDRGNFLSDNERLIRNFTLDSMKNFWNSFGEQWNDQRCPIVVICLTNMALDQFLEGVLKRTNRIIRLGSQSKSTLLEPYLLNVIKESTRERAKNYTETNFLYYDRQLFELRKAYRDLAEEIQIETKRCRGGAKSGRLVRLEQELQSMIVGYAQLRAQADVALCRNADVIGLTTTGAARRGAFLRALKPKIVVVEEAAQVLEAHIVSSLTTSCEHLIMIGDHKQLRPPCSVHELAFKYRLDVSLFERLAHSGFPSVMLQVQHRMQPEVARLIVPVVYAKLENHHSVMTYPNVPPVQHSVFLLDHREPEVREPGGSSYFNQHEAAMALRLAHFLIDQGVQQEQITILAAYAAQIRAMLKHRKENYTLRSLDRVLITTIDNYQGEENDIVILSLVRSNTMKSCGFLSTPNRVNVALSRARHGLYILANMELLCHSNSPLWMHVKTTLVHYGQMGDRLNLRCDRHPQEDGQALISVKKPTDFPMGGLVCRYSCGVRLECGHPCKLPCRNECQHNAAFCEAKVNVRLVCGHSVERNCPGKTDLTPTAVCTSKQCNRTLDCGHPCPLGCADSCSDAVCRVEVELSFEFFPRKCSHALKGPCYLNKKEGRLIAEGKKLFADKCTLPCQKQLDCGHLCKLKCHEPCASVKCVEVVDLKVGTTGKGVKGPCYILAKNLDKEKAEPCCLTLSCGHLCSGRKWNCQNEGSHAVCLAPCEKLLQCGHTCNLKCHQDCNLAKCQSIVELNQSRGCSHPFRLPCHLQSADALDEKTKALFKCQVPCGEVLDCGHNCSGTCGECTEGLHRSCTKPSKETLLCGHPCQAECGRACPPCSEPCRLKCAHRTCTLKCSEPCTPCSEPCEKSCSHTKCSHPCFEYCNQTICSKPCPKRLFCGHPCSGLCGELCPDICSVCKRVPECLATRYVYLIECGHSIPVDEMDDWMIGLLISPLDAKFTGRKTRRPFRAPTCPRCGIVLHVARGRYADDVKSFYEQLAIARDWFDFFGGVYLVDNLTRMFEVFTSATQDKSRARVKELVKGKSEKDRWMLYERMHYAALAGLFEADVKQLFSYKKSSSKSEVLKEVRLNQSWAEKELLGRHKSVQESFLEKSVNLDYLPIDVLDRASSLWKRLEWQRQFRTFESTNPGKDVKDKVRVLLDAKVKQEDEKIEKTIAEVLASVGLKPLGDTDSVDQKLRVEPLQRPISWSSRCNWIRCLVCEAVYTPCESEQSCPNADCNWVDQ